MTSPYFTDIHVSTVGIFYNSNCTCFFIFMCPVSQYPETHQLLKNNLQNLLDNILGVLEEGDKLNDVDALKKKTLLKVVIKLLKNVKEESDIVTKLRDWEDWDRFLLWRFEGSDEDIKF